MQLKKSLIKITAITTTKHCLICGRLIRPQTIYANYQVCVSCYRKLPFIYQRSKIDDVKCLAIYEYSGLIKEMLLSLKVRGDIELAKAFLGPIKNYLLNEYQGYQIIPIPSRIKQDQKRGFNHVVEIFKVLGLPIRDVLIKNKDWKQSDQHFKDRSKIRNILGLKETLKASSRVLLVDDIMTTGETMRAAIKLLQSLGIKNIRMLVVAKRG